MTTIQTRSRHLLIIFEQASKLNLSEKYKEYLNVKTQELKKRADAHKLDVSFVKEFLQTNDADKFNKPIEDYNKKSTNITEEIDELSEKGRQIIKDNPNIFNIK